jgi:hypothetical protein
MFLQAAALRCKLLEAGAVLRIQSVDHEPQRCSEGAPFCSGQSAFLTGLHSCPPTSLRRSSSSSDFNPSSATAISIAFSL